MMVFIILLQHYCESNNHILLLLLLLYGEAAKQLQHCTLIDKQLPHPRRHSRSSLALPF